MLIFSIFLFRLSKVVAQTVEAVEYTDFISAGGARLLLKECVEYDIKQSHGET